MCHKLCSFHQYHKHTRGDGDNFGLNYAMGCRSLSMKTAARDSCEVVVNRGRVASLARPVATSPACRSRRPTWLASGANPPPVGDLGQCRQCHWRAGDARGSGNRPQARLEAATSEIRQAEDIAPAFDTFKGRAEALYVVRSPLLTDSVEKVFKMKLWNQSLKQSNPSKWSFESMLLVRRSP
jgi:hypothetical protein